jgi:hypothetical protein
LVERLPKVAALVSVISPRYVRSEWCVRELNEFMKATAATGGVRVGDKTRIFKVVKTPVPLDEQPAHLQEVLGYEFYSVDPDTGRAHEFSQTSDPEGQKQYWAKLDDLAHDIAGLLRSMETMPTAATTVDVAVAELRAPTPAAAVAELSNGKATVYLAETSFDLRDKRDAIKRELQGHGHMVLPERPLPLVDGECREFVNEQLERSKLSVHLIGENYGVVPEGGTESFVVLQSELAIQRSLADSSFARLIWLPEGLDSEDERQLRFVDHLQTDARIQEGADVLECPLEDFKTTIHNRLKPPEKKPAPDRPEVDAGDELIRVYLICDQRDGEATVQLEDYLFDQGYEVILPVFDGDEAQVRSDHEENLSICDAVLLYWGAGNELWMRRKLREVQRSAAYGRAKPMIAKAIYTAPPEAPQKQRVRTREAIVLHQGESFSAEVLQPFVNLLKGEGA